MARVFVGHDWAEAHHDVHVEDETGRRLAVVRLPEGIEGVRRFHELVAAHAEEPGEVTVATETEDRRCAPPRRPPALGRGTGRGDPEGAACRAARSTTGRR